MKTNRELTDPARKVENAIWIATYANAFADLNGLAISDREVPENAVRAARMADAAVAGRREVLRRQKESGL